MLVGDASGVTNGTLTYDVALDYARAPTDRRILPRVLLGAQFFGTQEHLVTVSAVLDTGADLSAFDGTVALRAGWTMGEIVGRALGTELIYGIGMGRPVPGYLHEITAFIGGPTRFAELRLRVLVTPPETLEFSVLGRSDFFEQVDVTFVEFEKRLYLRFRNSEVLRQYS